MIIGICGKSGSGKSTLAHELMKIYKDRIVHLDIDKVGHNATEVDSAKNELVSAFGNSVINDDESINRKSLGNIVFESKEKMQILTDITWKYMQIEIDNFITDNKDKIIILDWILLPKSKYFDMCDFKILLDVPYELRKQRAMQRDNITSDNFDLREKASVDYNYEDFDYVLKDSTKESVQKLSKILH